VLQAILNNKYNTLFILFHIILFIVEPIKVSKLIIAL